MIIFLLLIFEITCGFFLPKNESLELFSVLCIFINSIVLFILFFKVFKKEFVIIIFIAYFLRLIILFVDYNNWFPIIHSGADTELFHYNALSIMENGFSNTRIFTNYGYFTGLIYSLIGPQRLFLQYLNVLFGMGTLFYLYYTFQLLKLSDKAIRLFLTIGCIMPHLIIFSCILLRESIIIFASAASVYYFIKWIYKNKLHCFIISCCFILLASWLHSGMIGGLIGYLIGYSFYNRRTKKLRFTIGSIIVLSLSCILLLFLITTGYFSSYFRGILNSEDEILALVNQANLVSNAGSVYLTWLNINSPIQIILFSPIKMFYFLFSPIPTDWRGINDIVAFFLNSSFLLYLLWLTIINSKYAYPLYKSLIKILLIVLFITVFIYGYGTFASGTAMRHRTKIVPVLIVTASIAYNSKLKYNNKLKIIMS